MLGQESKNRGKLNRERDERFAWKQARPSNLGEQQHEDKASSSHEQPTSQSSSSSRTPAPMLLCGKAEPSPQPPAEPESKPRGPLIDADDPPPFGEEEGGEEESQPSAPKQQQPAAPHTSTLEVGARVEL